MQTNRLNAATTVSGAVTVSEVVNDSTVNSRLSLTGMEKYQLNRQETIICSIDGIDSKDSLALATSSWVVI